MFFFIFCYFLPLYLRSIHGLVCADACVSAHERVLFSTLEAHELTHLLVGGDMCQQALHQLARRVSIGRCSRVMSGISLAHTYYDIIVFEQAQYCHHHDVIIITPLHTKVCTQQTCTQTHIAFSLIGHVPARFASSTAGSNRASDSCGAELSAARSADQPPCCNWCVSGSGAGAVVCTPCNEIISCFFLTLKLRKPIEKYIGRKVK